MHGIRRLVGLLSDRDQPERRIINDAIYAAHGRARWQAYAHVSLYRATERPVYRVTCACWTRLSGSQWRLTERYWTLPQPDIWLCRAWRVRVKWLSYDANQSATDCLVLHDLARKPSLLMLGYWISEPCEANQPCLERRPVIYQLTVIVTVTE